MMLKALPLLAAVFGVLRGRRYTSQWLSMLSLLYLVEGVLRAGDPGLIGVFAMIEIALAQAQGRRLAEVAMRLAGSR